MKAQIPNSLLADWFTKSLLPQIAQDVSMSGAVTEEQAIRHAQHLDLIYSQVGMLYNIIPHAPWSSNENLRLAPRPHADSVMGSISSTAATQLVGQLGQLVLSDNPANETPTTTTIILSA